MIHIQYLISNKDKSTFWIKPLWCPIGRPFCIAKWSTKQGINICPLYCGVRRETDGATGVWCKYDEIPNLNILTEIPENCLACSHYRCLITLGDICILYREFRDPCSSFMYEERFIALPQNKFVSKKKENS
jgi:hypothetical protein